MSKFSNTSVNTKILATPFQLIKKVWILLPIILLLVGQACTPKSAPPATRQSEAGTADPQFDWFKYEGNDPVYRNLLVGEDEYVNPINAGFYPDPSITR